MLHKCLIFTNFMRKLEWWGGTSRKKMKLMFLNGKKETLFKECPSIYRSLTKNNYNEGFTTTQILLFGSFRRMNPAYVLLISSNLIQRSANWLDGGLQESIEFLICQTPFFGSNQYWISMDRVRSSQFQYYTLNLRQNI